MAGDQSGHQLIADLLVGHRGTIFMSRSQQHRQHVGAIGVGGRLGPALFDELEDQSVSPLVELLLAA